ncbi:MAG: hypothetical protein L0Y80_09545 [Ignavibacteriae bacterium]|nr:hypothetical protein [Ignavibacteriota bacterium]
MKILYAFILMPALSSNLPAQERTMPIFVSTQWLADHLNDPDVVVLHVSFSRKDYLVGHIPGSRFLWYSWLAESTPDLNAEMASPEKADTLLEGLGVTNDSRIVLCFTGANITPAARTMIALTYYGLGGSISLLDGGFEAWKNERRPVSTETPVVKRTSLTLKLNPSVIADADWVKDNLNSPNIVVIDARTKNFYDGNGGGVRRQGHIKGAKNIPFNTVVDSTTHLKDVASLKKMFDEAGVTLGSKVVTYCHVGQTASLVYAAAKSLGYEVVLYDGSFEDWNFLGDEYPVVNPSIEKK